MDGMEWQETAEGVSTSPACPMGGRQVSRAQSVKSWHSLAAVPNGQAGT